MAAGLVPGTLAQPAANFPIGPLPGFSGLQGFEGEAGPLETQKVKEWSQLHTVLGGSPNSRADKYQTSVWLPGQDFFSLGGQNVLAGADSGKGFTTAQLTEMCLPLGQGRGKAGRPSHRKEKDPLKKASGYLKTLPVHFF